MRQAQHLFLGSWIAEIGGDLLLTGPAAPGPERYDGVAGQMLDTKSATPGNLMSDSFVSALYAAGHRLIIIAPYFVRARPGRGVDTSLVLPVGNDYPVVAAACRSACLDLLRCGVRLVSAIWSSRARGRGWPRSWRLP